MKRTESVKAGGVAELDEIYADYLALRSRLPESDIRIKGLVMRFRDALRRYETACRSHAPVQEALALVS